MTEAELKKLTEIKFYYFIRKLYRLCHDIDTLLSFFESVCAIGLISSLVVKDIVLRTLNEPTYKIHHFESIHILYKSTMPVRRIASLTGTTHKKIYELLYQASADPPPVRLLYTDKERQVMDQFLDVLNMIGNIGGLTV